MSVIPTGGRLSPAARPTRRGGPRAGWGHVLRRGVGVALAGYAGLVLVLFCTQNLLIFPGWKSQGRASARVTPPAGTELVRLTTRAGDRIVALFGPALQDDGTPLAAAPRRPTVIYFYGNGGSVQSALARLEYLRRLGVNVLGPEYVGYGMSSGQAGEAGCYATAETAYDHLRGRADVDPARIIAMGESLGGAVAIDLAWRRPVAGLVTFSTFTSMGEVAARQYPLVPTGLLLQSRFDSRAKLAQVRCPVLLGHGERDRLIPAGMCDGLCGVAGGPVTRLSVPGAGHNDLFEVGGEQVTRALRRFLAELAAGRPS